MFSSTVELIANSTRHNKIHHSVSGKDYSANLTSQGLLQRPMLPLRETISLGMVSTTKDCTRSKGVQKFSSELCSVSWVSIMDHIVRQAKLSNNTLRKTTVQLVWHCNSPAPKVHAVKTVYFVKQSTQVKMALQTLAQGGNPVIKYYIPRSKPSLSNG